jgi:hypothetical protein
MKLITKDLLKKVPPLYAQDGKGFDAIAYAKFFTPDSNWTWYMTEYDPDQKLAYGLVEGLEKEQGYFSIEELESIRGPLGLAVERDRYFEPCALKDTN